MKSAPSLAFLSCSFRPEDAEINNLVKAICDGLDIQCINVKEGYKETPPDKAKQMITEAILFIAIAVKRNKEEDGTFTMPHAVHDEISMAFAIGKPMLIVKELGVSTKGFLGNYGTFLEFDRDKIHCHEFLKKLVSSIHTLKLDEVSSHDLLPDLDGSGFYQESVQALYELVRVGPQLCWRYSITRRLSFLTKFHSTFRNSVWVPIPPDNLDVNHRISHKTEMCSSSKPFKISVVKDRDLPQCVETSITFSPAPEKGDFVEICQHYESPYLNQTELPESGSLATLIVGDRSYHCCDGFVPIVRTKLLRCQFRFPREYLLTKEDIFPFVGSYSAGIDYLVESEMKRVKFEIEDFGGNLMVDFRVESPLVRHMYGLAWNIPLGTAEDVLTP